jgi:hypothetical protein
MTITEFTRLSVGDVYFEIVDATIPGYMTNPKVLITADKNVVRQQYGDRNVVGFEPKTKKTITLYAK